MIRLITVFLLGIIALIASCSEKQQRAAVAPPIPGQEPAYQTVIFNAEDGGTLITEIGSIIEAPANAFVDSLGNLIEGEVELQFREFSDAEGVFLSGIPMEVSQKNKDNILSTASMWEVRASQNGKSLSLDSANDKTLSTTIASNVDGKEYDLWQFDENSGEWTNISPVEPEANPDIDILKTSNNEAAQKLERLDLSKCFVLNFFGLLDVYKPQDKVFDYFHSYMDREERISYITKLRDKAEGFNLQWIFTDRDYESAVYYGKTYPAALLVWEADSKLPNRVKRIKDGSFKSEKIGRHRYKITFYNRQNKEVYSTIASIKMPLKDLYRVGKDNWLALQDSISNQLQIQEARLATLGTVRRTFEVDQLGIYNYDKILNQEESLPVFASLTINGMEAENAEELMVFCYMEDEKSVIRYYFNELDKFILYPEANYKVFCVTGPGKIAYLPDDQLKELVALIPTLKDQEKPQLTLPLITYDGLVNSAEDFRIFLENNVETIELASIK